MVEDIWTDVPEDCVSVDSSGPATVTETALIPSRSWHCGGFSTRQQMPPPLRLKNCATTFLGCQANEVGLNPSVTCWTWEGQKDITP